MAPTPITVTCRDAKMSCGTSDSWRENRLPDAFIKQLQGNVGIVVARVTLKPCVAENRAMVVGPARSLFQQPGAHGLTRPFGFHGDIQLILDFPGRRVCRTKYGLKVDFHRKNQRPTGTSAK